MTPARSTSSEDPHEPIPDDLRFGHPAHTAWLEQEYGRLLAFGRGGAHPGGGFAWLDDDGRPELDRPVELWITARMTHVYSVALLRGDRWAAPLVDHGLEALTGPFHDQEYGGCYPAVTAAGPTSTSKTAYEHAFVVLAASSASLTGRRGARELLDDAVDALLEHFWDDDEGMLVEEWDRAFTTLDGYRGINANMHGVEALLAAADVLDRRDLRDRAARILTRSVHDFAAGHQWRLPEHFDDTWRPLLDYHVDQPAHPFRPYGATIGHWLEWARLALHLRAALGDDAPGWLLEDAGALVGAAVREGWAADGADGFVYTVDWHGTPVVRQRMHWVAAEAIGVAAALCRVRGSAEDLALYSTSWRYVRDHLLDPRGSWHHELDPQNRPSAETWPGKPDLYHAVQATLLPRLPLAPSIASAVAAGLLDT